MVTTSVMNFNGRFLLLMAFLASLVSPLGAAPTLQVPAGLDARPWEALLKKYVDEQGLVAYGPWKNDAEDMKTLATFLERYKSPPAELAEGAEEIAALINAYNAFTVQWILQNYPTESIRALDKSFDGARWQVGGRTVSLDEIEHQNLRPLFGWKVHATVACAARSCPPLQRQAFTAANLESLTEQVYRTWLARDDLNRFDPAGKRAEISPVFKWFKDDFTGDGEITRVLARYAPKAHQDWLARGDFEIEHLDYHWGLNDQSERGADYSASWFLRLFGDAK